MRSGECCRKPDERFSFRNRQKCAMHPLCAKRNASFLRLLLPEDKSGLDRCHVRYEPCLRASDCKIGSTSWGKQCVDGDQNKPAGQPGIENVGKSRTAAAGCGLLGRDSASSGARGPGEVRTFFAFATSSCTPWFIWSRLHCGFTPRRRHSCDICRQK